MHTIITDTAALAALCERLAKETFVTVDTEFLREKTYYPQLCLIQLGGTNEAAAVDPLAADLDLAPLKALLTNPRVLKVFHACKQDMEIFYQVLGELPAPIYDTQIAAMVCGFGESVGYESLVNKLLNKSIDKSSRFTDWSKRPLTEKQIDYAIHDVVHLRDIYTALMDRLAKAGRASWIDEEMQPLQEAATYITDENEVWRKVRMRSNSPRHLALLQAAARWRELTARAKNVPRGRIMKDETLAEVAVSKCASFADLQAVRGFYPTLPAAHYDPLFAALAAAAVLPSSECPRLPSRDGLPDGVEGIADLLRLLLRHCASQQNIVPRLIADKDELEELALGRREGLHVLAGWRNELFGKQALSLLAGDVVIKIDGRRGIVFEPRA